MIKLKNYDLVKFNIDDENDIIFFKNMNGDGNFKRFFGKINPICNHKGTFMCDYLLKINQTRIGYVHLSDKIINQNIIAVTIYYYIDKSYRGKGIATNVLKELMEYLTIEERINYFILNIDKENVPSIHVALNNNFIQNLEDEEEIQFIHKTL